MIFRLIWFIPCVFFSFSYSYSQSWPQWRGADASGRAFDGNYPIKWSLKKNLLWSTKLPGRGHSSVVHESGLVWTTSALETEASEKERKERLKNNEGQPSVTVLSKVSLRALRLDPHTGKIIHNIEVIQKKYPQWVHKLNSYASPTPVIDDGRVYFHFGAYGNACLNAKTGKIIWKNNQKKLWVMHENGPGSSPLLWKNLMIFHLDGSDRQSIVALYKDSGVIAWQTVRSGELRENPQLRKSYSTPILETINGKSLLISCSADWVYGYDPKNGQELWKIKYGILGFSNVARPVVGLGMFYISTCFSKGEIHAYRFDGSNKPSLVWKITKGAPKIPSPILVGKQLYIISDGGILSCVNAITGSIYWRERLAGEFSASPTFANGLLYFSNQQGKTTVIKPGMKFEIVAENTLDGTPHMSSITPFENSFLLRSSQALYRIGR